MNSIARLRFRLEGRVLSWATSLAVASVTIACGGGGGDSGGSGSGGPTAVSSGGPCVQSVTSGFRGTESQLAWQGVPPIAAVGGGTGSAGDGSSAGDGGSGGADGAGGAAAGGDLGKVVGARVIVRDQNQALIGEAISDQTGLVTIKPCGYTGPVMIEIHGQPGAKYFDEATGRDVDFPAGQVLKMVAPRVSSNLVASTHTTAAVELLNTTSTQNRTLTVSAIDKANRDVLNVLDAQLPNNHRLQSSNSMTQLPVLVDSSNTNRTDTLLDDDRGRYAATLAGLAKAAKGFRPNDDSAALRINQQLADDLSDGRLDLRKNGVPIVDLRNNPGALTYTHESLWLSLTVGAGSTSTAMGNVAMRSKAVPLSLSSVSYGANIPLTFKLLSNGKLQYEYTDNRGFPGAIAVDGDFVELAAYAGRTVALKSDRRQFMLGANPKWVNPRDANTSITWMAFNDYYTVAPRPSSTSTYGLTVRDSNGAFWRMDLAESWRESWTRLPYSGDYLAVLPGFRNKVYGLNIDGRVTEWPNIDSLSNQRDLGLSGVVQVTNHADHGVVLALTSGGEVYWVNRSEVFTVTGGNISMNATTGLPNYVNGTNAPLLVPGLANAKICWISGSYLAACDGSLYRINTTSLNAGSPECRSWTTSISGVSPIILPANVKIWRITTQKSPHYRFTTCNGAEEQAGEAPVFYSEDGNAFGLNASATGVSPLEPRLTNPKPVRCAPFVDDRRLHFGLCDDLSRATEFLGTWRGTVAGSNGVACQASLNGATGVATLTIPGRPALTFRFNGDQYDDISYYRNFEKGDIKIVSVTDSPTSVQGPFIEFGTELRSGTAAGPARFGVRGRYNNTEPYVEAACDPVVRVSN